MVLRRSTDIRSQCRRIVVAAAISVGLTNTAFGQAFVARIDAPLPIELEARVAELLRAIRPADAEIALAKTKTIDSQNWRESKLLLLRVEADCKLGFCMTVITQVTDRALVPELMLIAGKSVLFGDEFVPLWGVEGTWAGIVFEGSRESALVAKRRNGHWVVGACGNCTKWPSEESWKSLEPSPKASVSEPRLQTFEEFRREIDRRSKTSE